MFAYTFKRIAYWAALAAVLFIAANLGMYLHGLLRHG